MKRKHVSKFLAVLLSCAMVLGSNGTMIYAASDQDVKGVDGYPVTYDSATSIDQDMFNVDHDAETYTGSAIEKKIESSLTVDTDYTVDYENNTDAGIAKIIINGIGDYEGEVDYYFTINPLDFGEDGSATITLPSSDDYDYTYDGTQKRPDVTVTTGTQNEYTLTESHDYTVSYGDNVNAGEDAGTVTITGDGSNCINSMTENFTIDAVKLPDDSVTVDNCEETYDGATHSITVNLSDEVAALNPTVTYSTEEGGEYTEEKPEYTDVGTNTVYYKVTFPDGNYNEIGGSGTVTIRPINIEDTFVVTTTEVTYSGGPSTIHFDSPACLVEGTDYEVSYTNNEGAGKATITITSISNNCRGTLTKDFIIDPAEYPNADDYVTIQGWSGNYDTEGHTITVEIAENVPTMGCNVSLSTDGENYVPYDPNDPDLTNYTFTDVGTYTVYYMIESNDKNYVTKGSVDVEIESAVKITADDFIVDLSDEEYTGNPITKKIESYWLEENKDYEISYKDNTNVGQATIIITGIGAYSGDVMLNFNIIPAPFKDGEVVVKAQSGSYDGTAYSIDVELSGAAEGATVTYSEDGIEYTEEKPEYTDVGTYTIFYRVVSMYGNYETTGSVTVTITPKEITEDMFDVDQTKETYTGEEITKEITPTYDDMKEDIDYTVSYAENINVGVATITITAVEDGNYTGEATFTFSIVPASIDEAVITASPESYTYDGSAKTPDEITVTLNGKTLVEGTDYTVSYSDNVDAGEAKITIEGMGNYTETATGTFTINPAPFDDGDVTVTGVEKTYDGNAYSISVELSGAAEGATVTYSYAGSEYAEKNPSFTEAGTYTVYYKVTSEDKNYETTGSATVIINPAEYSKGDVNVTGYNGDYDGNAHSITVELSGAAQGATVTYSTEEDGKYSTDNPTFTDAGTYTVYYKVTSEDGDYEIAGSATVNIQAKAITDDMFSVPTDSATYNGSAITKNIESLEGLVEGTDYEVSYADNTNAGEATITITGIGNYSGEQTYHFTINKAVYDMSGVTFPDMTYTYDGTAHTIKIEIEEGGSLPDGVTVSYTGNTGTEVGTYNATAHFNGDYDNYETIDDMTATMTIADASFGNLTISASGYTGTYDGKAHSITVTLSGDAEGATVTYSTTGEEGSYTTDNPSFTEVGTYTVYYKVTKANYNVVTGTQTVEITEAPSPTPESKIDIKTATVTHKSGLVYNGSKQSAGIKVTASDGTVLKKGTDYELDGQKAKAAGTHKAVVTGIGYYTGSQIVTYKIKKAEQELSAVVKKNGTQKYSVKASKLKNASKTFKIKVTKKGNMKVRYSTNSKKIKVNKNGKVTLKKGLKKGTYTIKVTTGASKNYKANQTPIKIKVTVK